MNSHVQYTIFVEELTRNSIKQRTIIILLSPIICMCVCVAQNQNNVYAFVALQKQKSI